MPNHCSHPAKSFYYTYMVAGSLQCPEPVPQKCGRCYAVCHTDCSSSSFVSAAFSVNLPAGRQVAPLCSTAPHYASFHLVRSKTFASKAWPAFTNSQLKSQCSLIPFRKPAHSSLGSIPLRSFAISLQPCSVHRLPIILLAGYPHFGCVR